MRLAAFLLIAGTLPAFADDFDKRWPPLPPQCISVEKISAWVGASGGAFKNLRVVNGSAVSLLSTILDWNSDDDAGPDDWTFMMLLDAPLDGGGLILAGHPGEVCQYLVISEDDWADLLFAIQEKRA